MTIAIIDNRVGKPVVIGAGAQIAGSLVLGAQTAAAVATAAAETAEAALASIIADPDVSALSTTSATLLTDRIVVYRSGTPLLFNGMQPVIKADGATRFGGGTQVFSADATLSANRVITATPDGSPHGIASQDILNWSTADLSYAGFDDRTLIQHDTPMGHHIAHQSGMKKTGSGDMDFIAAVYHNPELQAGSVDNNYGLVFEISNVDGATVGRHVALYMTGVPTNNGVAGNPNYVFLSDGGARSRVGGQFTAPTLFISPTEGEASKQMHVASAADTEASFRLQQQGYNTLDLMIPASSIDGKLVMNNLDQWVFDYQAALLPGADNTFNIGASGARIKDTFQVNAATVSSDARLKANIRHSLTDAELRWAAAIRPACYQMVSSIEEKGRASLAVELGEAALAALNDDEAMARMDAMVAVRDRRAALVMELGEAALTEYHGPDAEIRRRGMELAREHTGFIAQEVYAAGIEAGIADPLDKAFLCRDPKFVEVRKTRTAVRDKMQTVTITAPEIEVRDGVPVQVMRPREAVVPVTETLPVVDEAGKPVMIEKRVRIPGKGKKPRYKTVTIPKMAEVPVQEEYEQVYFERERALDENGEPDWHWSLRYEELLVFLLMAGRA